MKKKEIRDKLVVFRVTKTEKANLRKKYKKLKCTEADLCRDRLGDDML